MELELAEIKNQLKMLQEQLTSTNSVTQVETTAPITATAETAIVVV